MNKTYKSGWASVQWNYRKLSHHFSGMETWLHHLNCLPKSPKLFVFTNQHGCLLFSFFKSNFPHIHVYHRTDRPITPMISNPWLTDCLTDNFCFREATHTLDPLTSQFTDPKTHVYMYTWMYVYMYFYPCSELGGVKVYFSCQIVTYCLTGRKSCNCLLINLSSPFAKQPWNT